jgi:hypothetical protein
MVLPVITCPTDLPTLCNDEFPSLTATWTDNCAAGGSLTLEGPTRIEQSPDGCSEIGYYDFEVYDDCGNLGTETCSIIREFDIIGNCETAFAKASEGSQCFIPDFSRWGWTNHIASFGEYTMDLWAGAAHCDTSRGALVGTVTVNYTETEVTVTYNIDEGYVMSEAHVYVGCQPYPVKRRRNTVAPGQYPFNPTFTGNVQEYSVVIENDRENNRGGIYVIAHAVTCEVICMCSPSEEEMCSDDNGGTEFMGEFACSANIITLSGLRNTVRLRVHQNTGSEILNVNYELDIDSDIKVEVLDLRGVVLKREFMKNYKAGSNETIQMNMSNVTDDILFVRLTSKEGVQIKKIILKK